MKNKFMPLKEIKKLEPDMERLKVSEVARGKGGFLPAYKRANGNPDKLSDKKKKKRDAFIARHKAQYEENPTKRRKLALNAWAYNPRVSPKVPRLK